MKRIYIIVFVLSLFASNAFAQRRSQQRPQRTINPEKEQERYEERAEEQKKKYIADFVGTLKVDDFQKEIITQQMDSYFEELRKINKMGLTRFERQEQIEALDVRHFKDTRAMVSEDVMNKIMDAVKGKWDQKAEKKKKKKRKRKNKDKS
ncbi:hypothetical protein [uncultured Psychroserpens sp.]|uniref:hypothetical protein n=1 Tax=uncultured Psychroserpens sp. TaxID=255436 RepID=UPI0026226EE9|nr:hypothetical protein [uncultured Psychroserpens sp.]